MDILKIISFIIYTYLLSAYSLVASDATTNRNLPRWIVRQNLPTHEVNSIGTVPAILLKEVEKDGFGELFKLYHNKETSERTHLNDVETHTADICIASIDLNMLYCFEKRFAFYYDSVYDDTKILGFLESKPWAEEEQSCRLIGIMTHADMQRRELLSTANNTK